MRYGGVGMVADVWSQSLAAVSASQLIYSGQCFLTGVTYGESTGAAPAKAVLFDGADVNGERLDFVSLAAGGFNRNNPGEPGLPVAHGVFLQVVSGTIDVTLTMTRWVPA